MLRFVALVAAAVLCGCGGGEGNDRQGLGGKGGGGGSGGVVAPSQEALQAACEANCEWREGMCRDYIAYPFDDHADCVRSCVLGNRTFCELDRVERCTACRNGRNDCVPRWGDDPCFDECFALRCSAFDDCKGTITTDAWGYSCEQLNVDDPF